MNGLTMNLGFHCEILWIDERKQQLHWGKFSEWNFYGTQGQL